MATDGSSVVEISSTCTAEGDTRFGSPYERNKDCFISSVMRRQVPDIIDLTSPSDYERKSALGRIASSTHDGRSLLAHKVNYVDLEDDSWCDLLLGRRSPSPQKRTSHVDISSESHPPRVVLPPRFGHHSPEDVPHGCSMTSASEASLHGAMYHLEQHHTSDSVRTTSSLASTGSEDGSVDLAADMSSCSTELSLASSAMSTSLSMRSQRPAKPSPKPQYVDLSSSYCTSSSSVSEKENLEDSRGSQYEVSSTSNPSFNLTGHVVDEGLDSNCKDSHKQFTNVSSDRNVKFAAGNTVPKGKANSGRDDKPTTKVPLKKENPKDSKPMRHILSEDWEEDDPPYQGPEREEELVRRLREMKQTPPPGPFCREDLTWEPIRTQSGGRYYIHEVAVIPWKRLSDFREGEGQDKLYPCSFNKETVSKNKPGSLVLPRANSAAKVIK